MNYTKGDWKIEVDEHDGSTNIATETQNIARMCYDDHHTLRANANLIAAAPILYEALQSALSAIKSFRQTRYERGQEPEFTILKALAKAEGKEV